MAGRIPEEVIAEIRDRTDIVEVIGRHVTLKRSGTNHKGCCPFHDEKTPSFNVNPARQFFHCFGCQESGDVIGFLMKIEGRTFMEVIEELAERAGVDLPREERTPVQRAAEERRRSDRQQAIELNARVARLYQKYLESDAGAEARAYLEERGINAESIERFQLGFAPPSGDAVARRLAKHGVDMAFADRMGLVAPRRRGEGHHDRFWNRVIFPLAGIRDEILGFGGRLLGDADGPKYINTPETALYRKGEALYGIAQAATAIRQQSEALLVEGNFDVIQMHQAGWRHTVAPMGTALTEQQARLLKRFAERVVAIFDGDNAGRKAAEKSVPVLLAAGLDARIAALPAGEDPDSLIQSGSSDVLQRVIDAALPAVDYVLARRREEMEDTMPGRAKLVEEVAPLIASLPSQVLRELYTDKVSLDLQVDRAAVTRAVGGAARSMRSAPGPARAPASERGDPGPQRSEDPRPSSGPSRASAAPVDRRELDLIKILLAHPRLLPKAKQANLSWLLTNEALRATYSAAARMQSENGRIDFVRLLEETSSEARDAVAEAVSSQDSFEAGDPNRMLDEWLVSAVGRRLQRLRSHAARASAQEGASRVWAQKMVDLQHFVSRLDGLRRKRQLEGAWALLPELIQVERDIDETN